MSDVRTVVIADDHSAMRASIRRALEEDGFAVVAEAHDAAGAVAAAQEHRPDVCVLDIQMPGGGVAAAAAITSTVPGTAVVMLTVSRDEADIADALRAGAAGYVIKGMERGRLPLALRAVLHGDSVLPRGVARMLGEAPDRPVDVRPFVRRRGVELTEREWEVLALLRDGLTTRQIADRLFVTPETIRSHVSAAMRKLGVTSRAEAVALLPER